MNWFWLNIPLDAVFFLAMTGIPLWLVFKHPDTGPAPRGSVRAEAATPRPASLAAPSQGAAERELVGAAR